MINLGVRAESTQNKRKRLISYTSISDNKAAKRAKKKSKKTKHPKNNEKAKESKLGEYDQTVQTLSPNDPVPTVDGTETAVTTNNDEHVTSENKADDSVNNMVDDTNALYVSEKDNPFDSNAKLPQEDGSAIGANSTLKKKKLKPLSFFSIKGARKKKSVDHTGDVTENLDAHCSDVTEDTKPEPPTINESKIETEKVPEVSNNVVMKPEKETTDKFSDPEGKTQNNCQIDFTKEDTNESKDSHIETKQKSNTIKKKGLDTKTEKCEYKNKGDKHVTSTENEENYTEVEESKNISVFGTLKKCKKKSKAEKNELEDQENNDFKEEPVANPVGNDDETSNTLKKCKKSKADKENDKSKIKNKDEERKNARRKSSKVYPTDFDFSVLSIEKEADTEVEDNSDTGLGPGDTLECLPSGALVVSHKPQKDEKLKQQRDKEMRRNQALQLLSLPSEPWTPCELIEKYEEEGFMNVIELYNHMNDGTLSPCCTDPSYLLLLDARDAETHAQHHIATAKMANLLSEMQWSQTWPALHDYSLIVIYDENGLTQSLTESTLSQTTELLKGEGLTPFILREGYQKFRKVFPFLCCSSDGEKATDDTDSDERNILKYPSIVLPDQLYLGTGVQAGTENIIQSLGITHIINISTEHPNLFEDNITYLTLSLMDDTSTDIQSHFLKVAEFIEDALTADGRVLVHCSLGASRSATAVLAYLMMAHKWTLADAFNFLKRRRPIVAPNRGFLKQLASFEKKLYGKHITKKEQLS